MEIGRRRRGPLNAAEKIERNTTRQRGSDVMQFPADLGAHAFLMNFVEYSYNGDNANSSTNLSVALPLPGAGIIDQAAISYNAQDLGTVGATVAATGGELLNKLQNAGNETGSAEQKTEIDYQSLTKEVLGLGGAMARENIPIQSLKNAADLALGNITNPHIALLFQAVGLKQFKFQWKLAPATQDESDLLKKMIKKMQKAIHPEFVETENNFFLKYPNQVDCYYQGSGDYLHFFKRAAITEFSVNYQPEGGNVLFAGTGAPTFVELSMGFQEVEIWTAEDYE